MKNKKIKIIVLSIIILVIIAGIVVIGLKGINKGEEYQNTSMLDLTKPYSIPAIVVIALSIIYYAIMYRKKGSLKISLITFITIILSIAFAISIYGISRLPVNRLFMPILLVVFIADFLVLSKIYSKK